MNISAFFRPLHPQFRRNLRWSYLFSSLYRICGEYCEGFGSLHFLPRCFWRHVLQLIFFGMPTVSHQSKEGVASSQQRPESLCQSVVLRNFRSHFWPYTPHKGLYEPTSRALYRFLKNLMWAIQGLQSTRGHLRQYQGYWSKVFPKPQLLSCQPLPSIFSK